jgi:3-carboxy-cis,cis-muconate cycloisomerase
VADVFERFLSTSDAIDVFGERSFVQAMLDFEAALAHASADAGLIPVTAAPAIAGVCKAELFDLDAIVAASGNAGSLAIPLVKKLTETVALFNADAARYVHWGATSQDVIDTAMALVTQRALTMLDDDLAKICVSLTGIAHTHRDTPVLARTLMQAAQVTSFGLKAAQWLAPIARSRWALRELAPHSLCLQLGGAFGTRAALGPQADVIAQKMATCLGLTYTRTAWHTQRDRWMRLACEVAIVCGSLGKIATDIALMAQSEVAELAEPSADGRGSSSAMPHKRNPVGAMVARAAALRAPHRVSALLSCMGQEHERGLGNWQAELAEWAGLFVTAQGAASALAVALSDLNVDAKRMRENIDAQSGLVFAEAASIVIANVLGKAAAHTLVEGASRRVIAGEGHLRAIIRNVVIADPKLTPSISAENIDNVFSAESAARFAGATVDDVLAELQMLGAL